MSSICPNQGLRVRLGSSVKFKALARNLFKPKLRMSGESKLKAKMSVIYRGFPRGTGVVPDAFFGSNFGFNPNDPSLYVKSMRCSGNIRVNTTKISIHRCVTNLSEIIFNPTSPDYIKFGDSGISPSVYIPQSANNSTSAHSAGPQIIHSLITKRSKGPNFKFIARASIPINNFTAKFKVSGEIKCRKFEKLNGYFDQINSIEDYAATDKLYPIRDIVTTNNGVSLVNEKVETEDIYQSINEGISLGNITKNGKVGSLVCDDGVSFITPSSIYTEGEFFYKCEVTAPSITPRDTFLFIRASAPVSNNDSDIPPEYNITNIRFEDPSGNLIAKYKDITVRGEQDHDELNPQNGFITYVTEPEVNMAALNTWKIGYPILGEDEGYTLSMDIKGNCFYHAFEENSFDDAFQEDCNLDDKFVPSSLSDHMAIDGTPLSTMSNDYNIRPANALRISAIELANRGFGFGILRDNHVPLYLDVVNKGDRLTRTIYPTEILSNDYTNNIYPTNTINVWKTSPDIEGNVYYSSDHDSKTKYELQDRLSNIYIEGHITLDDTTVPDSGKLQLLYEHKPPFSIKEQRGGAFNFGNTYQNGFNRSAIEKVFADDSFFIIEEIILRIEARKAPGTPDFPIDVVGYSDDGVLVSTRQVGGFLQNSLSGVGDVPMVSGYSNNNDLGISSRTISNREAYYESPITSSDAGDHYKIDNSVMVNSTEFEVYDVPLTIYKDKVELGRSPDYSMSTYFESLYLDIYPIPSGASIANAGLVIKYQPTGALKMNTLGSPKEMLIANRKNTLHPTARKAQDKAHNANITSLIENLPHGYETSESTLKTNYSRRWRGSSGLVSAGAFESAPFGFGFSFPQLDTAFVLGRYDFRNVNGVTLNSINGGSAQGTFSNPDTANNVIHSIGSRFISNSLFSSPVRPYQTLDWVPAGDILENRIIDAFDHAVRVSGVDGHINFGDTSTSEGFSILIRFSPDVTMSGVDYNLWNSGVLFQKQDAGQDLEYGLRYNNGKLEGFAREDGTGNTITVSDTTDFYDYQYPLSILLTYNAGNNQKLKLYTENEIASSWTRLRDESQEFVMHSGNSDLTFGYSKESGAGLNAFITEIGLASVHPDGGSNLVDSNPNPDYQQDSVDSFFDSHSMSFSEGRDQNPLWKYVDERTEDWQLGSFKYCQFNTDYDIMTKRIGRDYVYHTYVNDGLTYADRTDIDLPDSLAPALDLAYHSQVENDMLRFNLDGREERFYAIKPRIQKDLPRSYITEDDALQVNTVLQHESFGDVVWDNGEVGAKIIVSLYTPAKESELLPTKNYGLISRSTHYVSSEDCWTKIASRFTINDVKDSSSEPWSYFEKSITKQELKENYFAREIDEMFIQYDIVYPSGTYSQSEIIIHSLDVSLYGALQEERTISNQLAIYASGDAYSEGSFNLYADCYGSKVGDMNLYSSGVPYILNSADMNLVTSGTYQESNHIPLYSFTVGTFPPPAFGSATFGSDPDPEPEPDFSDPYRNSVKLYLPFDNNSYQDKSLNYFQASKANNLLAGNNANVYYPEFSNNTPAGETWSGTFGTAGKFEAKYISGKWNYRGLKYEGCQFDPTEADQDWMIDFWYYLFGTGGKSGYYQPLGGWRIIWGFSEPIFTWGAAQRTSLGLGGDESKYVGMSLGWANGRLVLNFGFNSAGLVPMPDDYVDPIKGLYRKWGEYGQINIQQNSDTRTVFPDGTEVNDIWTGRILAENDPGQPLELEQYHSNFEGYEDIRNTWAKIVVRKIGSVIQMFVNEEKVAEAYIGGLKFDFIPDNAAGEWRNDDLAIKFWSESQHDYILDDFRITMGSARGTDPSVNPMTSPDAVQNGLSFSDPTPLRDPAIEPPVTTTTTTTFPPVTFPYLTLNTLGSLDFGKADLNLSVEATRTDLMSSFNQLKLMLPDQQVGFPKESSVFLYIYCDNVPYAANSFEIVFDSMSMYTVGPDETFTEIDTNLNLFLDRRRPEIPIDAQMPLYLYHKKPVGKEEGQLEAFVWDSNNIGTAIDVVDNDFSSIPADDDLRGVNTVCYGDCDLDLALSCSEVDINTHDTLWFDPECVDGGVARGLKTYTNIDVNAFGTNEPYDRHYYGIRKFQNLIPNAPYDIKITAKTGTDKVLDVPRELKEWEYGTKNASTGDANEDIDYNGTKLTVPQPTIEEKHKFAKAVSVLGDRIFLGCPFENSVVGEDDLLDPIAYPASYELEDNGKIYVYRKTPEPSGNDWSDQPDKSPFYLEQEIVLPTGYRRDGYFETKQDFVDDTGEKLPFEATVRNWVNLGEGRQLGSSLDSTSTDGRDVLVAGGPGSIWSRNFPPIVTTPVKIALFLFNNELNVNPIAGFDAGQYIRDELKNRDILYRYFADPPVSFDIKIILLEPMLGSDVPFTSSDDFVPPIPDNVTKYLINRHFNLDYNSPEYKAQEQVILQELINIFHAEFPIVNGEIHNGLPPLFSFYIDDSRSLGTKPMGYFDDGLRSGALNKFIEYYEEYSLNNGVTNYNGQPASGGHKVSIKNDENWIYQSITSIRDITDIDYLNETGYSSLIADNLGTFDADASEFNRPPPSGGGVYIFEKSHDKDRPFELLQRIQSPVTYTNDVSDRFGHDVAISDNAEIIVIGSPYTDAAVQIWQYQDSHKEIHEQYAGSYFLDRFLSELSRREADDGTFGEGYQLYEKLNDDLQLTTSPQATRLSIHERFSETLMLMFKEWLAVYEYEDYPPPYRLIKTISYTGMHRGIGGQWSRLYERWIPTTRMGFSVDTNEDGTLIAIGCPTDSLGERDSEQTWFRYDLGLNHFQNWQWHNYTNAGAVRLLEARDYYPHDRKVVEYYKFGNLHELLSDPEDSDFHETALYNMFNSQGLDYSRTSFSEDKKIPEDAGMAMIITPAIDAASDEIIENIREWLTLGDRNLILVGNDPKWEANGAYAESNRIINYILSELDIKLRIYAARSSYDALIDDSNLYLNAQASFVPAKTTKAIGKSEKLHAYGVGDIRFYDPGKSDLYQCDLPPGTRISVDGQVVLDASDPFAILEQIDAPDDDIRELTYRELHTRCELPIIHEGDLRAKYGDQCTRISCKGEITIHDYEHNLAFMYGSHTTCNDWNCTKCDDICPPVPSPNLRDNSEPIPILAAYEKATQEIFVDEVPERVEREQVITGYNTTTNVGHFSNGIPYSGIDFLWTAESGLYRDLNLNINNTQSKSLWYDPTEYNGEDAILQARTTLPFSDIEQLYSYERPHYVVQQANPLDFPDSHVWLVAGVLTESREVLLESGEGDKNLNLYFNMVAKDKNGSSKIAQIGGFTNRASFTDGYIDSDLPSQLTSLGMTVESNVPVKDLNDVSKGYDVAWIANTDQMPSDEDIAELKQFLMAEKFRKVIITYGQEPELGGRQATVDSRSPHTIRAAQVAGYICEQLGISMRPMFLPGKNKLAGPRDIAQEEGRRLRSMLPAPNTIMATGYDEASDMRDTRFIINLEPIRKGTGTPFFHDFVPIMPNGGVVQATFPSSVLDIETVSKGIQQLRPGVAKVTFDVPPPREDVPESDDYNVFKIFVDISSQSELENLFIEMYFENATAMWQENREQELYVPMNFPNSNPWQLVDKSDTGREVITPVFGERFRVQTNSNRQYEFDVRLNDYAVENGFSIYFHNQQWFGEPYEDPARLLTSRLVSISGVRVNAYEKQTTSSTPIFGFEYTTIPAVPEYSYEEEFVREISNNSDQYCFAGKTSGPDEICAERWPIGYGEDVASPPIADGPMLVAQEIYHQGRYLNGHNKSRVTVISDPSLIQGRTILTEDQERVNEGVAKFLASLYPYTYFYDSTEWDYYQSWERGRDYEAAYKIISPERGSPKRLLQQQPENSGLIHRWGNYDQSNIWPGKTEFTLNDFTDDEGKEQITPEIPNNFVRQPHDPMLGLMYAVDAGTFRRPPKPPGLPPRHYFSTEPYTYRGYTREEYEQEWYVDQFVEHQERMGVRTKLYDVVDGVAYEDAGISQRIPEVMRQTGHDHLDFEVFNSGYPGDLFGYKVTIHRDKIYVGSPFSVYNGENDIVSWDKVIENQGLYGTEIGYNGGAGAVYVIERTGIDGNGKGSFQGDMRKTTGIPWELTEKFRPESINVGYTDLTAAEATGIFGDHPYTDEFLRDNAHVSDMFGYNIALDGDILAISAPGHDFDTIFEKTPAPFMRKEFNEQFDITKVYSYDMSLQENRDRFPGSGTVVINNGAVFTYENKIVDWGQKIQSWSQIHKLVPEGFNSRVQGSGENTYFGKSIDLFRARRVDADYIIAAGADGHKYSKTDGTVLDDAGAAWTFDGMLRKLRPAFSHPDTYITGRVYGQYEQPDHYTRYRLENGTEFNKRVVFEGRIISTRKGEIFIEASGQDGGDRGYVVHRPYIEEIKGTFAFGEVSLGDMPLFMEGYNIPASGDLPLILEGPDRGTVYNTIDLTTYNAVLNSGDMNLVSSGAMLFGDQQFSSDFYQEAEDVKELQDKIYNASNVAFLISRGGH